MKTFAGVDAGGTKTIAAIGDGHEEVARAVGPAGAVRPGRAMAAAGAIATTVRRALAHVGLLRAQVLVVGASGVGRDEERQALRDALRIEALADRLVVTTDIEIALEAAFGAGPGIVLLAGTGSFGVARLPDGTITRQGGYGWQMGDDGSAYAIGKAALTAVGRGHDGRGPTTGLEAALIAATRTANFGGLVRWSVSAGPSEVAGLAATVLSEASSGDPVAAAVLDAEAASLARHVEILRSNWPEGEDVSTALAGGLLEQEAYRRRVEAHLDRSRGISLRAGVLDPVQGALAIATRQLAIYTRPMP